VDALSEQGQGFVGFRHSQPQLKERAQGVVEESDTRPRRWGIRLPSLRGNAAVVPPLGKAAREEWVEEKARQKQQVSVEEAKQAFFTTPAGRARLAYRRGHRLFQYELEVGGLEPTVIPGPVGAPGRETTDPVDVLNSVTVEGWKLVTGKFIHSELRGGVVGCYLFKRSQKRRLAMNDPWQNQGTIS
jgi:hypothetical protein